MVFPSQRLIQYMSIYCISLWDGKTSIIIYNQSFAITYKVFQSEQPSYIHGRLFLKSKIQVLYLISDLYQSRQSYLELLKS